MLIKEPASIRAHQPRPLKMKQVEFITLSACTMMLTALGIDIMLPVFGQLRGHFQLPAQSTATSHIITFFFLGQIAQLFFGVMSDRFGRLPILRVGFPLYILGGILATYATSLPMMFAARFVAGVGSSAVFMATIAGVRDRFVGDEMARVMSLVLTIFLFTPVIAPFLGLGILSASSWQMVFLTPPLFAVIIFVWSLRLEESLPKERRNLLHWVVLKNSIGKVLLNKTFLRYTTITTVLFAGLSCYVSSSERIVGEIYGKPELFPWIFATIGLTMAAFTFINARLSSRYGARKAIRWLLYAYLAIASVIAVVALMVEPLPLVIFFSGVGLLMAINVAIEPNSSALAMEPLGSNAGIASSVYGTCFFFIGAGIGAVISYLTVDTVLPLAISFLLIGSVALALIWQSDEHKDSRESS